MNKNKSRYVHVAVWMFCVLFAGRAASAFHVEIKRNRLSIQTRNAPFVEIMNSIKGQMPGLSVKMDPGLHDLPVTIDLDNVPFQNGIEALLSVANYILIWKQNDDLKKDSRQTKEKSSDNETISSKHLAEIIVFRDGKQEKASPIPGNRNFSLEKDPETGYIYVKNEILIRFKKGTGEKEKKRILDAIHAVILEKNESTGIYRLRIPEDLFVPEVSKGLSQSNSVELSEPNYAYPVNLPGKFRIQGIQAQDRAFGNPEDGTPPVAVLDSGATQGYGLNHHIRAYYDAIDSDAAFSDPLGHGTQMALVASGIVSPLGTAPPKENTFCPVIPVRALDENGYTSVFTVVQSIDFALENKARVVSLSWGAETPSQAMESAFSQAAEKGLILVASSGNEPTGKPVYPAAYRDVIAVGAALPGGQLWEKSNNGDFVTAVAPGFADFPVGYQGDSGSYGGTSISAAYLANRIALYIKDHPDADQEAILEYLNKNYPKNTDEQKSRDK